MSIVSSQLFFRLFQHFSLTRPFFSTSYKSINTFLFPIVYISRPLQGYGTVSPLIFSATLSLANSLYTYFPFSFTVLICPFYKTNIYPFIIHLLSPLSLIPASFSLSTFVVFSHHLSRPQPFYNPEMESVSSGLSTIGLSHCCWVCRCVKALIRLCCVERSCCCGCCGGGGSCWLWLWVCCLRASCV